MHARTVAIGLVLLLVTVAVARAGTVGTFSETISFDSEVSMIPATTLTYTATSFHATGPTDLGADSFDVAVDFSNPSAATGSLNVYGTANDGGIRSYVSSTLSILQVVDSANGDYYALFQQGSGQPVVVEIYNMGGGDPSLVLARAGAVASALPLAAVPLPTAAWGGLGLLASLSAVRCARRRR